MRATLMLVALSVAVPASAGSTTERWSATSTTAAGITGDISLSPTRLVAAGKTFPLAVVADVKAFGTGDGPKPARILRVTSAANPRLLNGNTLCDPAARWIVVYRGDGGRSLNLAAFSGAKRPTAETDPGLCATFLYSR